MVDPYIGKSSKIVRSMACDLSSNMGVLIMELSLMKIARSVKSSSIRAGGQAIHGGASQLTQDMLIFYRETTTRGNNQVLTMTSPYVVG